MASDEDSFKALMARTAEAYPEQAEAPPEQKPSAARSAADALNAFVRETGEALTLGWSGEIAARLQQGLEKLDPLGRVGLAPGRITEPTTYEEALAIEKLAQAKRIAASPKAAIGGSIVGTIGTLLVPGGAGAKLVGGVLKKGTLALPKISKFTLSEAKKLVKAAKPAVARIPLEAGIGAVAEAGQAEPGERLAGAEKGALLGAGAGLVGRGLAGYAAKAPAKVAHRQFLNIMEGAPVEVRRTLGATERGAPGKPGRRVKEARTKQVLMERGLGHKTDKPDFDIAVGDETAKVGRQIGDIHAEVQNQVPLLRFDGVIWRLKRLKNNHPGVAGKDIRDAIDEHIADFTEEYVVSGNKKGVVLDDIWKTKQKLHGHAYKKAKLSDKDIEIAEREVGGELGEILDRVTASVSPSLMLKRKKLDGEFHILQNIKTAADAKAVAFKAEGGIGVRGGGVIGIAPTRVPTYVAGTALKLVPRAISKVERAAAATMGAAQGPGLVPLAVRTGGQALTRAAPRMVTTGEAERLYSGVPEDGELEEVQGAEEMTFAGGGWVPKAEAEEVTLEGGEFVPVPRAQEVTLPMDRKAQAARELRALQDAQAARLRATAARR